MGGGRLMVGGGSNSVQKQCTFSFIVLCEYFPPLFQNTHTV